MEASDLIRTGLALVCTLGIIGLVNLWLRRYGGGAAIPKRRKDKRLQVEDALVLDGKRKLMLVTCDAEEHLLLIGANGETVIASHAKAQATEPELVRKSPSLTREDA